MAAILGKTLANSVLKNNGIPRLQFVRLAGYWNKDWKPGPYPKTDAERIAAAKKYGLLPQDYEPYPDDGFGYGDYPKLPLVSTDQKDPFHDWDYPDLKRNFAEPLHVDYDMYTESRMSNAKTRYTKNQMVGSLLGAFVLFFGTYYIFEYNDWKVTHPRIPKQYPNQGKTHYTFEPLD